MEIMKANALCQTPSNLFQISKDVLDDSTTYTSKESFLALAFRSNKVIEYNLDSGSVSREFGINNNTEMITHIDYSPDHDYLYAATITDSSLKVIVFDASSGDRKKEINTDLSFVKGGSDGDGFLAADSKDHLFYVNKNGDKKQVWALPSSNDTL